MVLSRRDGDRAAADRARPIFAEQCASCHGPAGLGDHAQGAPNLTDAEWLYGAAREEIRTQIWSGRNGVMPAWAGRFDEFKDICEVVYLTRTPAISTTAIIEKISDLG